VVQTKRAFHGRKTEAEATTAVGEETDYAQSDEDDE
jgi:hypothetical protein